MENLGLIAPAGSPFQKSAHKYNKASWIWIRRSWCR